MVDIQHIINTYEYHEINDMQKIIVYHDIPEIINKLCKIGKINIIQYILNLYPNIEFNFTYAFKLSCKYGHLDLVKFLIIKYDIKHVNANIFKQICLKNQLHIATYLLQVYSDIDISICDNSNFKLKSIYIVKNYTNILNMLLNRYKNIDQHLNINNICIYICKVGDLDMLKYLIIQYPNINIHLNNEYAFKQACMNNQLHIVKYLISVYPNINIRDDNDYIFKYACVNHNVELATYLTELCTDYTYTMKSWNITSIIDRLLQNQKYDQLFKYLNITKTIKLNCNDIICLYCKDNIEHQNMISFNCRISEHVMHIYCAHTWYKNNNMQCLLCQIEFKWSDCSRLILS